MEEVILTLQKAIVELQRSQKKYEAIKDELDYKYNETVNNVIAWHTYTISCYQRAILIINNRSDFQDNSEYHAHRIAENIHTYAEEHGEPSKDKISYGILDVDETAKVINDYLQNEI